MQNLQPVSQSASTVKSKSPFSTNRLVALSDPANITQPVHAMPCHAMRSHLGHISLNNHQKNSP